MDCLSKSHEDHRCHPGPGRTLGNDGPISDVFILILQKTTRDAMGRGKRDASPIPSDSQPVASVLRSQFPRNSRNHERILLSRSSFRHTSRFDMSRCQCQEGHGHKARAMALSVPKILIRNEMFPPALERVINYSVRTDNPNRLRFGKYLSRVTASPPWEMAAFGMNGE